MKSPNRRVGLMLAAAVALLAVSIPALAVSPSPSAAPEKSAKPEKGPETPITLEGVVNEVVDAKGRPTYTMSADGKTWTISAGPPWFWGNKNPLAAFAGKSVTIVGSTRAGDPEVDVETVDGKPLREPGKPPWAGGPWVVGPTHPGWKPWMADGKRGNGHGRDNAPGQVKKESAAP